MNNMDEEGTERARKDRVRAMLRSAFGDDPVPSGSDIIDVSTGDTTERQDILARYGGRRWWEREVDLGRNCVDLFFMTDVGWRYYLPACLSAACDEDEGVVHAVQSVSFLQVPGPDAASWMVQRFDTLRQLSTEQVAAIAEFLRFMQDYRADLFPSNEPGRALDDYWATCRSPKPD
jgi:hypothetical protein